MIGGSLVRELLPRLEQEYSGKVHQKLYLERATQQQRNKRG
jgi:hypothetical protein